MDIKILALITAGALAYAAPLASQQTTVARLVVTPAHPEVMVGDSVRLAAQALDSNNAPVPDAKITFKKEGLQGADVEADGLFRAGARGTMQVVVSAIVPGAKPVIDDRNTLIGAEFYREYVETMNSPALAGYLERMSAKWLLVRAGTTPTVFAKLVFSDGIATLYELGP